VQGMVVEGEGDAVRGGSGDVFGIKGTVRITQKPKDTIGSSPDWGTPIRDQDHDEADGAGGGEGGDGSTEVDTGRRRLSGGGETLAEGIKWTGR
jgi:hypothetical protein